MEMLDDGAYPDDTAGDEIYSAVLSSMADGTNVHYYIDSRDDAGHLLNSPSTAPTEFYSFIVGPHVLINEVYANVYDTYPTTSAEGSEFIELYNPTGSVINLEDWTIENQYYPDTWAWPAGASISANDYLVIARDSMFDAGGGGYRDDAELTTDQAIPDWEMCDMEWGGDDEYDDPASDNMTLVEGNTHIKLNNNYDGLVLTNDIGTTIDAMEYGRDYWIAGRPSAVAPEECSLTRDYLHTDTDDSFADFYVIGDPTPGVNFNLPTINDIQWTPAHPVQGQAVTVTARVLDDSATPTANLLYSVNGGGFALIAMADNGVAPDLVSGDDIFSVQIPGQGENDAVYFYIEARTFPLPPLQNPYGAPFTDNYSYVHSPNLIISEVYYNSTINLDSFQNSKFVEIFNPTSQIWDIGGHILQGDPVSFSRQWAFPAGTLIASGEIIVVANNAGDASNIGFYTEFGSTFPDRFFELYDDDTNIGIDYDNPTVDNMILLTPDYRDNQLELGDAPFYDAVYLKHTGGAILDCMEYYDEGDLVPGLPAEEAITGFSLQRDELATDTDNCLVDFTADTPTPGALPTPPTTHDIILPAGTGWRFISFRLDAIGSIIDILDDANVEWDVAKWYDPTDASDPWKTYRVGSTINDMPFVDNTMGLWVHITNEGDGILTVLGSEPVSTEIELFAGWNMVSYPSITEQTAEAALTGTGADWIAIYQTAAPYVLDYDDLSLVTMTSGNAYWVHVPAYTVWTVDYI